MSVYHCYFCNDFNLTKNTIMITEKLQNAINEQITAEMWSANMYLAMSFYMEKEGYCGMAHWLKKQWAEENEHAVHWPIT